MSDEDRKNINFSCPEKLGILSDLLDVTKKSRKVCVEKRWQYTRKSGEKIIFVDLFNKIVKWINLFKEVGEAVVQYDPIHAALPWAGVRFLLQVCSVLEIKTILKSLQIAVNDSDKFAFVVESATSIAEIICRYAVFEGVWRLSQSATASELVRALVIFYTAIMIYLSKAKSYFNENTACKFGVFIIEYILITF